MFVQEVMTREPTTVTADTTIKGAAQVLATRQISALPVLDAQRRLCGVVSEADLIRNAFADDPRAHMLRSDHHGGPRTRFVFEVMTLDAITVRESADVAEVAELMTSMRLKSLPVVDDDGHLVGVVSRSDLVRLRARADVDIEREVDSHLVSLGHADWLVAVRDGGVQIDGPATVRDRSLAEAAAGTVAGVVTVKVR